MGLESVELALMLEESLSIQIPPGSIESAETIREVVDAVRRALCAAGREPDPNSVADAVRTAVAELSGIPPDQVADSTRFREDLNWG